MFGWYVLKVALCEKELKDFTLPKRDPKSYLKLLHAVHNNDKIMMSLCVHWISPSTNPAYFM